MGVQNKASCEAVIGKAGSGKSTFTKRMVKSKKPKRIAIWSLNELLPDGQPLEDWAGVVNGKIVRNIQDLAKELNKATFKVVFFPSGDVQKRKREFEYFCQMVFKAKNLMVVVEELHYVTSPIPSQVPESWTQLSCLGRKFGIHLVGTSQRPAHMDKDFLGNCSRVICLAIRHPADRKAVSENAVIPVKDIEKLVPLEYIISADDRPLEYGKLTF